MGEESSYKKWTSLIAKQFGSWEICRQLWAGNSLGMAQGGLLESVMDALGNKATSTIHARVSPLLQLVHYYEQLGYSCFPLTEHLVYEYMKNSLHKAPSFHRSLLLAISFASFHFGWSKNGFGIRAHQRVRSEALCGEKEIDTETSFDC